MKRHNKVIIGLTSCLLAIGLTLDAHAEPICIAITAEVALVDDRGGILAGAINVGDVITGTYVYESTTPDTNSAPTAS